MNEPQVPREAVLRTLVVCDLVGSTRLTEEMGDARAAQLFEAHDRTARALLEAHQGREIDKTDGFLLLFVRPINAVHFALAYHEALHGLSGQFGLKVQARVGIHLGEVLLRENLAEEVSLGAKPLEAEGLAKPMAARVMALALPGQTLMTRGAFDLARRAAVGDQADRDLHWLALGSYLFKGVDEPTEVFEVGVPGSAPLTAPTGTEKARRVDSDGTIPGWRPAPDLEIPQRPNWEVTKKLGEGGFGEVWLAIHRKTHDRRVFKFCYDAESLHTLKRETALFRVLKGELGDRADIARILDWSFEEAPYFIESEYTEGGNFTEWAAEHGGLAAMPLELRLEIIAQIAEALAAAHSVGVLHKDVKPSNVLIATGRDGKPQALLTDFGIGRIVDEQRLAASGITRLGLTEMAPGAGTDAAGTRLYMAPELLEGKAATVQADIYALGVMLYQVVIGDFSRAMAPGWSRKIEDELLSADIASAVDGSPKRRLGNAIRLAERLRSLDERRENLAAERRAREEAERAKVALVRARRRRRVMVAAIVVLTVFAGAMAIQARRIALEAERANREARTSEMVATFLVDLFKVSDPSQARGETITAREVLDRGALKVRRDLAEEPEVMARLLATMGTVYRSLGLYDSAQPLLEDALQNRRSLYGEEHPKVADSLNHLAELLRLRGHYDESERLYRDALAMRRRLFGDQHLDVTESLVGLATVLSHKGEYAASEPLLREALSTRKTLLGEEAPAVAESLELLGLNLFDQGDYDGPVSLLREGLAMRRKLLGEPHPAVAEALNNLAFVLHRRGDHPEAATLFREALAMKRKLLGDSHPEIASALNNLAFVLHDQHEYTEAEAMYRDVIAMRIELLGEEHDEVAQSLNNLAFLLHDMGQLDDAVLMSRRSLEILRKAHGTEHPSIARAQNNLARWIMEQGDHENAESLLNDALTMRKKLLGEQHPDVAVTLTNLANLLVATGRYEEGRRLAEQARSSFLSALSADHWRTAVAESVIGASLTGLEKLEEAESLLLPSYATINASLGADTPYTKDALQRLVELYDALGKSSEAGKYQAMLNAANKRMRQAKTAVDTKE